MIAIGKRILVVGAHWLGDVLFSTPALRALRKSLPEAYIACAVPPRCAPILRNNAFLNEVVPWEDKLFFWTPLRSLKVIRSLKEKRFDTAIFFHRSKTKALVAMLSGIGQRIGYEAPFRKKFLTVCLPPPEDPPHRTDYFLGLIQALGLPATGRTPDFFPDPEAAGELERVLARRGVGADEAYVVVHAGGNWELKRWPVEHFVRWIGLFLERYPMKVVLCGAAPERALSETIISRFPGGRVVSLCGETSLDALAHLLKKSKLLLSNDSGPIHLAASQGARILGLFGPTSAGQTGPISNAPMRLLQKDVGCEVPCYFRSCRSRVCMEWLGPEEAFSEAAELLQ